MLAVQEKPLPEGVNLMQLTIDIGYDQVFQLVRQLPPREKTRLHESVFSAMSPTTPEPVIPDDEYYEFLMNFPVVSEEEIEQILEAKKEVNKCQPVSL